MLPGHRARTSCHASDVDKGKRVSDPAPQRTIGRRKHRRNIGSANFDEIRQVVVRDRNLEFEMFKQGDLDYYYVHRAQMWVEELNFDNIQRGLIQKRKVFNHNPQRRPGHRDEHAPRALTTTSASARRCGTCSTASSWSRS